MQLQEFLSIICSMKIGPIDIKQPIVLAPMEDVTDIPFRLICRRMGADIVYTEFTSSEAIIREAKRALKKIRVLEEERPVAIQIYGGVEESMQGAAQRVEKLQPDFIDINCGCWVKNHAFRGEGAGLLRDLNQFERIVKATVKGTKLPVTVKTRLGWDDQSIVILDVAKMLEQCGIHALTVHCRTRCQGYQGTADWSWIEKIKKATTLPLIANGDIDSPEKVKQLFDEGCDGVMIGRAAIGNPWFFKQTKYFLQNGEHLPTPSMKERIDVCIEHLKLSAQHRGLPYGVTTFRKYYAGYLKEVPNVAHLRKDLMQYLEPQDVIDRLYQFLDQQTAVLT